MRKSITLLSSLALLAMAPMTAAAQAYNAAGDSAPSNTASAIVP